MPIFGRYLLKSYFKVLVLSVFSFIAVLLVSRLQEIAEFAAMGAKASYLALFILYQIPYILPIAIPVSCLISSLILFQRLSLTNELMALRASGISLKRSLSSILIAGSFLSLMTFYLTSELATSSHLSARKMIYDLSSVNPLLLLQNAKIAKLKGAYVQMNPVRHGQTAKDLIIAINNERLHLCIAKKIKVKGTNLKAENVSLISSSPSSPADHLVIENQKKMHAGASEFSKILKNQGWKIANDYLKFSFLRIRFHTLKMEIEKEPSAYKRTKLLRAREKCKSEIVRRISMGLATFTFTLMGASFGIEISRRETKRKVLIVMALASFALISFFIAKEFDHLFWLASLLFLLPHLVITMMSFWMLQRANRGIE